MTKEELAAYVTKNFDGKLKPLDSGRYDPLFEVEAGDLLDVARALKEDENLKFDYLCNICGVDTKEHFEVVYNVASVSKNLRLDFKLTLPYDNAEVESVQ